MNPVLLMVLCAVGSYLIGSISNAVIVSKANGVDIFKVGSGNPGATNVKRSIGKGPGNLVFFLDLMKGFVVSLWPFFPLIYGWTQSDISPVFLSLTCLAGALIGHSFSIYIRFKGGKGVATAMGGLLAIMAPVVLLGILVWIVIFYSFRYVSLASIAFAASLPVISAVFWKMDWHVIRVYGRVEFFIALGICLLIVIRHHSNILRLIKGTEHKFVKKTASENTQSN